MKIIMNGRQVGKSVMAQMWNTVNPQYFVIDRAMVDGAMWYTVKSSNTICQWIKTQSPDLWHENIDKNWMINKYTFDIHEKIYTMLQLKYGDA